jgi:FG-GAP-like repeat
MAVSIDRYVVLGLVWGSLMTLGAEAGANPCGNQNTDPQIFRVYGVSPATLDPGGGAPANWDPYRARLERGGIYYVTAGYLEVNVVTDPCTAVAAVRLGSRELTTSNVDGYLYYTQPASPQPSDPTRYAHALRIIFPVQQDGSTDMVTVVVRRTGSGPPPRTVEHGFPLVHVKTVEAASISAPMGFSAAELFNMFGKAIYEKFNGPQNSTAVTVSGRDWDIYGYEPDTLNVVVTSNGVGFTFKFQLDVPACDPTVRAYGTFKVVVEQDRDFGVEWVQGPRGSLDWHACTVLEGIPIFGIAFDLIHDLVEEGVSGGILGAIENAVLTSMSDPGQARDFLDGSSTRMNEMLINMKLPVPSVTIQVPYDAFDLDRSATLFPAGEVLALMASRLGMSDYVAGVPTSLWSGPNGVPLAGTTTWPNPRSVARSEPLVWNPGRVAQLMARNSLGTPLRERTYHYQHGCSVKPIADPSLPGKGWVRFGVNDTASDAQRLRGIGARGYSLRVLFLSDNEFVAPHATYCGSSGTNVLWRNADGRVLEWLMNGYTVVSEVGFGLVDGEWQIEGAGDFNGDGMSDILWRHTNGQVGIWYMSAGIRLGEGYPGGQDPGLSWTIQGVGDFDGDRHSDILWRDADGQLAIWPSADPTRAVYPGYGNTPAPVELWWEVRGVGDFNGDGGADILWRQTNGQVGIWYMSGGLRIGESYPGGPDPGHLWEITHVGDFDGNGRSDILWRDVGGQLAIWANGDSAAASYPSYGNQGDPVELSWTVAGVGDFNEDGRTDILWRHTNGQPAIWLMDGGRFVGDVYPRRVGTSWKIEGLLRDAR